MQGHLTVHILMAMDIQFSSVAQSCLSHFFVTPWATARQASPSITNSQSLLKLMSVESVMPSNHLILCRLLILPPSVFPSIRVFNCSHLHSHGKLVANHNSTMRPGVQRLTLSSLLPTPARQFSDPRTCPLRSPATGQVLSGGSSLEPSNAQAPEFPIWPIPGISFWTIPSHWDLLKPKLCTGPSQC